MDQNLKLEDLLGELGREGQLDSRGSFTLDSKAAVQKLSQFQLQDPSAYLAKIVQAAVASGSASCHIDIGVLEVECRLPGAAFDVFALGSLPGELLNAAISSVISSIELAAFDGRDGQKIVWKSGGAQVSDWRPAIKGPGGRTLLIKFSRNPESRSQAIYDFFGTRDVMGMLSGAESGWTRDEKFLRTRCDLCPIPVYVNGRKIRCGQKSMQDYSDGTFWSQWSLNWFQDRFARELIFPVGLCSVPGLGMVVKSDRPLMVRKDSKDLYGVGVMLVQQGGRTLRVDAGQQFNCLLWAGLLQNQKNRLLGVRPGTRLILVDDGYTVYDQTFDRGTPLGGRANGVVIASAVELSRDLSSLQLIDNQELHNKTLQASRLLSFLAEEDVERATAMGLKMLGADSAKH